MDILTMTMFKNYSLFLENTQIWQIVIEFRLRMCTLTGISFLRVFLILWQTFPLQGLDFGLEFWACGPHCGTPRLFWDAESEILLFWYSWQRTPIVIGLLIQLSTHIGHWLHLWSWGRPRWMWSDKFLSHPHLRNTILTQKYLPILGFQGVLLK